jgi:intein-encoded DNA endonuclease-like protein
MVEGTRPDMHGNKYRLGLAPWNKGMVMNSDFRKKVSEGNKRRLQNNPESYIKLPFVPTPSKELSYILGVRYGDGCLRKTRNWHMFILGAVNKDFVECFRDCCCKLLNKKELPRINIKKQKKKEWNDVYFCNITSKQFYYFLLKPISEHHAFIQKNPLDFLRGFFDSEGSFSLKSCMHLRVGNTNKEIMDYVKKLLDENGIFLNLYIEKRQPPLKTFYVLGTGKRSNIQAYNDKIGFTIKEKQKRLETYLENKSWK